MACIRGSARENSAAPVPRPQNIRLRPTRPLPLASPSRCAFDVERSSSRAVSMGEQATTTTARLQALLLPSGVEVAHRRWRGRWSSTSTVCDHATRPDLAVAGGHGLGQQRREHRRLGADLAAVAGAEERELAARRGPARGARGSPAPWDRGGSPASLQAWSISLRDAVDAAAEAGAAAGGSCSKGFLLPVPGDAQLDLGPLVVGQQLLPADGPVGEGCARHRPEQRAQPQVLGVQPVGEAGQVHRGAAHAAGGPALVGDRRASVVIQLHVRLVGGVGHEEVAAADARSRR